MLARDEWDGHGKLGRLLALRVRFWPGSCCGLSRLAHTWPALAINCFKWGMEQGLEALETTLKVLREYCASDVKARNAAERAGSGIVGLLEVCE